MKDNIEQLKAIPKIVEVTRISLSPKIKQLLGPHAKEAEKNEKKIFVYRIIYKVKGKKIAGFIVEPRKGNNLPCIIWNRGGSRDFGSMKIGQLFNKFSNIAPLATQGYIVIMTQYPGVAGGEGIDQYGSDLDIASILDLQKILKAYKRADEKTIGMFGHSRGGCMTYMCLGKVKWLKAAVIGSGPTNEVRAAKWRKNWAQHQKEMFGGSLVEKKKRSAFFWSEKLSKKTPLLIMHGTADWRVNPLDSIEMSTKLYEHKIPHRLIMYEGADHAITEHREEFNKQTINWFNRFLKEKEKLPNVKPHGI